MSFPSLDQFFTQVNFVAGFQKNNKHRNATEVPDPIWLDIQGEIPTWLNGVLYRIGPGKFLLGEGAKQLAITHAFDGLAYIHRFEFDGAQQKLRYNSRHTAKAYEKNLLENPFGGHTSYGTVYAIGSAWQRFMDFLARGNKKDLSKAEPSSKQVNVTITPNYPVPSAWTDQKQQRILVAKTDSNLLQKVNHDTLEPERLFDYSAYDDRLDGRISASHHQHDDSTQETFNVTISVGPDPCLTVFKIDDATGTVTVLAEIRSNLDAANTPFKPAYLHAFWLTQHYVVIPLSPIYFKNNGLDLAVSGNLMASMEWHRDQPTLFYVVSRTEGHVATVPVDSHFAFHTVHGRDYVDPDTGKVVLELNNQAFESCELLFQVHNITNVSRAHELAALPHAYETTKANQTQVNGFSIPPTSIDMLQTFGDFRQYRIVLDEVPTATYRTVVKNAEFSRVHPSYQFKPYRYVYFNYVDRGRVDEKGEMYGIKKFDLTAQQEIVWVPDTNDAYVCSEPVFIPRPGSQDEDDGVVLSLVNVFANQGPEEDHCYMLVLDAKDFKEWGRVPLGKFTATTFHGSFVDHEFISTTYN